MQLWRLPCCPLRIPPFFAIDHEGGEVNRLRGIASPLPSAQSVARFLKPEEAEKLYSYAAEQIAALGIHVNFAPLAETSGPHNSEFVGLRSFGSLEQTETYAAAFMRAFSQSGVFCVLKHFPGNTNDDPHAVLPVLSGSASEIENLYFSPFAFLLSSLSPPLFAGTFPVFKSLHNFPPSGVLMSHACVPAFDEKNPACFSPVLIREILQNKLDFSGLIFSDDLYMGALASSEFSPADSAEKALRAGIHIFMLSRSVYRDFIPSLAEKAACNPDLQVLIDSALTKILKAKLLMGLLKLTEHDAADTEFYPTLRPASANELYNPQNQIRRFNDAKQKGEALYYAHWAK
ncbi:glycoside hydrolase family 3 N-terminal domain-containing protein [Treponema sp. HNW]|uniref:glycoside hydrolase family 3 N-terminal domain-containing protein n=1 Tax=Treponema sp. HNW TaxID=3116654 RepID=UPI003D140176